MLLRIRKAATRLLRQSKNKKPCRASLFSRTLRCEPLEDRRLLSVGGGWTNALSSWLPQVGPAWFQSLTTDVATPSIGEITWEGKQLQVAQDRWIVQLTPGSAQTAASVTDAGNFLQNNPLGAQVVKGLGAEGLVLVKTQPNTNVAAVESYFANNPAVAYFEPDSVYTCDAADTNIPNDTNFEKQWALDNEGQTFGTIDADIDAPEAWSIPTGSNDVVVAVLDSGVDYTHPDLAANMWTNPGEIPNNRLDDDGDGLVDDVYGYNFADPTTNPWDNYGHGTHVAGIIAADGNDHYGVTGVAPHASIMDLKCLDGYGRGSVSACAASVNYVIMTRQQFGVNVRVMNASWGGPPGNDQVLMSAISNARNEGILSVCSAGNLSIDVDSNQQYPACCPLDNILSVASTDHNDNLAVDSNYGVHSVDLAAPGVNILSTTPRVQNSPEYPATYCYQSGTSMAAPFVSGAAALLWSIYPAATYTDVRNAILAGVDHIDSLNGKVATGGRLNVYSAINHMKMGVDVNDPEVSISPLPRSVVYTAPTNYTIRFTNAYDRSSIDPNGFKVNGHVASSYEFSSDNESITFHFDPNTNNPVTVDEGPQFMAVAANLVRRAADGSAYAASTVFPWQSTFYYLKSPITTSTDPEEGATLTLPHAQMPQQIVFTFNKSIDQSSIGTDDLTISAGGVTGTVWDPAHPNVVKYTVTGLTRYDQTTYVLKQGGLTASGIPVMEYIGHFTVNDPAIKVFSSNVFSPTPGTMWMTIPSTDNGVIVDLDVRLDVALTSNARLSASLSSPGGYNIPTLRFASQIAVNNFVIDDEANLPNEYQFSPLIDRFISRTSIDSSEAAAASLSQFDGINSAGTWTLSIDVWGGTYSLNSWSLIIEEKAATPRIDTVKINDGSSAVGVSPVRPLPLGPQASPGQTWAAINTLGVQFSEEMNSSTVENAANWSLRPVGSGSDIPISISYSDRTAHISSSNYHILPAGTYCLTAKRSITDTSGVYLDGNGDGTPNDDYVQYFEVLPRFAVTPTTEFLETFNDATLKDGWEFTPSVNGAQALVSSAYSPRGGSGKHLLLYETAPWTGTPAATLHLDLYGQSKVVLDYCEKEIGTSVDSSMDRIEISDDGEKWFDVEQFAAPYSIAVYQDHVIDLDAAIAAANAYWHINTFAYTHDFQIRFSQNNRSLDSGSNGGLAFDDVKVSVNNTDRLRVTGQGLTSSGDSLSALTITFNNPVDPASFTTADVTIMTPQGRHMDSSEFTVARTDDTHYDITFNSAQSMRGTYRVIVGPNIMDMSGQPMNQDQDTIVIGSGGVMFETGDAYHGTLLLDQAAYSPNPPTASVYSQDLEGISSPPPEWRFDTTGDSAVAQRNGTGVSGSNCLMFDGKYSDPSAILAVDVSDYNGYPLILGLWAKSGAGNTSGTLSVDVCYTTSDDTLWQNIGTINGSNGLLSTSYQKFELDLTAFSSYQPLYIRFRDNSNSPDTAAEHIVYLDDVSITSPTVLYWRGGNGDDWAGQHWSTTPLGTLVYWTNDSNAKFNGSGGTVTVSSNVTAGSVTFGGAATTINISGTLSARSMTFETDSYTLSGSGSLSLPSSGTSIDTEYVAATITSTITGQGGLTKNGYGTLTLGGSFSNSYNGATIVNAGTVLLDKADSYVAISGSGLTISNGQSTSTVTVGYSSESNSVNNMISNGTPITINANGILDFNGKTDTVGNVTITAAYRDSGFADGQIVDSAAGGAFTIGALTFIGGGTVNTANSSTWGKLILGNSITYTTASFSHAASIYGNIDLNGTRTFTIADVRALPSEINIAAVIADGSDGSHGITKEGAGTLTLSESNAYTGATTVNAGTLSIQGSGNVDHTSGVTLNGGTLQLTATGSSNTFSKPITLGSNGGAIDILDGGAAVVFGGSISGAGALTKVGAGALTLSTAKSYTGRTNVYGGTLSLGANNILPDSTAQVWIEYGGTLSMGANSDTVAGVHLVSGSITGAGTLTSTSGYDVRSGSISAVLGPSGTVGLTKTGQGTAVLSNSNTYSGVTAINTGVLSINSASNLGTNSNLSFDGGTLRVNGSGTININKAATVSPNGGTFDINGRGLTVSDNLQISNLVSSVPGFLVKQGMGTLVFATSEAYTGDTYVCSGTLDFTAALASSKYMASPYIHVGAGATFEVDLGPLYTCEILNVSGCGTICVNSGQMEAVSIDVDNISLHAGTVLTIKAIPGGPGGTSKLYYVGDGVWDTTTANWRAGSLTGTPTTWQSGYDAVFEGSPQDVAIEGLIDAGSVTFNTDGYTLSKGAIGCLMLNPDDYGITVNAETATIDAPISCSAPLWKKGSGTLLLDGINSNQHLTIIEDGGVVVTGSGNISAASMVYIFSGATLTASDGIHRLGVIVGDGEVAVESGTLIHDLIGTTLTVSSGATEQPAPYGDPEQTATIEGVTAQNASGTYAIGDWIFIDVAFTDPVEVDGSPQLLLNTDRCTRTANYLYGSGTTTLTFAYQVQSGDITAALDYTSTSALVLNGGTITTWASANADLALPTPAETGSLSEAGIELNTPYATVNGVSSATEGAPYTLQLAANNLGFRTITSWSVNWGDGYTVTYNVAASMLQATHEYTYGGVTDDISVTAALDDGTVFSTDGTNNFTVDVARVLPYLSISGISSASIGSPYVLHLSSSRVGTESVRQWSINWGDGSTETVNSSPQQVTHYYTVAGTYNISATGKVQTTTYDTGGTAAGALDPYFGNGGIVTTSVSIAANPDNVNEYARSMVIQSDGKIIVVGDGDPGCYYIARYNTNGSLDTDFGVDGQIITESPAKVVALQSDGKILVAGTWTNGGAVNGDFSIVRYNPDGTLDLSFGSGGKVLTDIASNSVDAVAAITVQADGKILLSGGSSGSGVLVRYNTDGTLDTGFASQGKLVTSACTSIYFLSVQSSGTIVACGGTHLLHYDADGTLQSDSTLTIDFVVTAVSIQSDGKIVAAGYKLVNGLPNCFALARYNTDGSLDTTFDGDGEVTTTFSGYAYAYSMAIQSDGKIVVAGSVANGSSPTSSDFALARYNADGSLDTTFDADGKLTANLGGMDYGRSVILQPDGRIVVAGYAMNDFAVARFYPGIIDVTVTVS
jgi:uncharacterized delta-60 repeat protein